MGSHIVSFPGKMRTTWFIEMQFLECRGCTRVCRNAEDQTLANTGNDLILFQLGAKEQIGWQLLNFHSRSLLLPGRER